MYYKETIESRELFLYAYNNESIYRREIVPRVKAISKHYSKGNFDKDKAIQSFYRIVTNAAKSYWYEFGGCYSWKQIFSVTDRWTAATDLLGYFMEDIRDGYLL